MEDVQVLRRRIASGELSVREAAVLLGHSKNTVKRYLSGAAPGQRKTPTRQRPVRDALSAAINALLDEERQRSSGKHRLTAADAKDVENLAIHPLMPKGVEHLWPSAELPWRAFIGDRRGQMFRLRFAARVDGPIRLGHASSFGLGFFD